MSPNTTNPTNEFDLIRHLSSRNMYQRLGLKSNAVTTTEIEESWRNCLRWIQEALDAGEIDRTIFEAASRLLEEARNLLTNGDSRRVYDVSLAGNLKKGAASVTVSNGRVTSASQEDKDRYELDGMISEGPRAKLWLARDKRFDRPVVVKQIHLSQLRTPELQQRFREEANFFASSNAVHLVKVLDFNPDNYQVILEWLPDSLQMLAERLRQKKSLNFTYNNARQLLRQSLSGLDVLHRRGWVHGRVCAAHILLDDQGNAKLSITPGLREVSTLSVPGKEVTHLAPEMLNPQVFGTVTPRADLYSLGFVILDLLCRGELRKRIFPAVQDTGNDQVHWFRWHASTSEQLPPLEQLLPDAPSDLLTVLTTLMQKRPADRPLDAETVLNQLDNLQQVGPQETTSKISQQLRFADSEMDELEDYGPPPRLPQLQYESKSLDWKGWLRAPTANYHLLSQNQKLLLGGGVLLVCSCLLVLLSSGKTQDYVQSPPIAETTDDEEEDGLAGEKTEGEFIDSDFEIPSNPMTTTEVPSPAIDESETEIVIDEPTDTERSIVENNSKCFVFVTAMPGFRVTGIDGHEPSDANPRLWQLSPGNYLVRFTDASPDKPETSMTRTIQIDAGDQFEHVIVGQEQPLVINKPTSTSPKPAEPIDFRVDFTFDIVCVRELNTTEKERIRSIICRLIDRAPLTLVERRATPLKLTALEKEKRRDPRVSFLLALDAYLLGDNEAAIALCRESIAVVELESLPFQLPYHLLSHIYAKERGRTSEMLSLSIRALKHAEKVVETGNHGSTAAMLGEELWFYGHVLQHVSDQTQITALDLNYWQRKGTELEARYRLADNPIQQGRNNYLANPYSQIRSPLRLDPAMLAERVRQTLPGASPIVPGPETTASR